MVKAELRKQFDQNATMGKLLFLAIISVALCSFGPLGLFAPVPLTVAFLLYGRGLTFVVGIACTAILWTLSMNIKGFPGAFGGMYLVAFLYALLVAEIIFRNINPVKGLTYGGLILVLLSGLSIVAFDRLNPISLKTEIQNQTTVLMSDIKKQQQNTAGLTGKEALEFQEFLDHPEKLATEIYNTLPSIVFVFSFFGLWISLFVTLRNSIIWRYKVHYKFNSADLLRFRAPDFFVWPLIISLIMVVGADYGLPKESETFGMNLIYCLGVFYLFQGFGVYNDFLKFIRIGGFFKVLFLVFTLFMAYKFLALLGLFDLWFDFRKYFTKTKKDEGDIL